MNVSLIPFPDISKLSDYQKSYIGLVPPTMSLAEGLHFSNIQLCECIDEISEEKSKFKYLPDKWSIKMVLMHISDTDKIFLYRALSIARGVRENLISFDENAFADNSHADKIHFTDIVSDYKTTAEAMQIFFDNLREDSFNLIGTANNQSISAATIGFLAAGHRLHHLQVLRKNYLLK